MLIAFSIFVLETKEKAMEHDILNKSAGLVLRSTASTWVDPTYTGDQQYGRGWDDAMKFCGNEINRLLDAWGVPQLDDEDE